MITGENPFNELERIIMPDFSVDKFLTESQQNIIVGDRCFGPYKHTGDQIQITIDCLNLLRSMLETDVNKRITTYQLANHGWLTPTY